MAKIQMKIPRGNVVCRLKILNMPEENPAAAVDVAATVIEAKPGLDQMQLHKILYFVQAAHLAWFGTPAFGERIEAWKWGPMVRGVAGTYMQFERNPITRSLGGNSDRVSQRTRWVVERIVSEFGDKSGPELANLTKAEGTPWRAARGPLPEDEVSDEEIPRDLIKRFHRLEGLVPSDFTAEETALAERFLDGDDEALESLFETAIGKRPSVT